MIESVLNVAIISLSMSPLKTHLSLLTFILKKKKKKKTVSYFNVRPHYVAENNIFFFLNFEINFRLL